MSARFVGTPWNVASGMCPRFEEAFVTGRECRQLNMLGNPTGSSCPIAAKRSSAAELPCRG